MDMVVKSWLYGTFSPELQDVTRHVATPPALPG
jgi:hypothetical protein